MIHIPRILVIDDNPPMAQTLADILEAEGYTVYTANSGKEALLKLREYPVDLLLTDIRMSGMNGVELTREARKINPDMDAILMTAYSDDEMLNQAKADGVKHVLDKPVDIPALLSLLRNTGQGEK